jgi:N-acetylglucosamine kinase-like BadF-type ATPase
LDSCAELFCLLSEPSTLSALSFSLRCFAVSQVSAPKIAYSRSMRCVLGFDGGGTKTDCVLMDESRQILARARSGSSNPTRIGPAAAIASLVEAAETALAASGIAAAAIVTIHGGIAGIGAARAHPEFAQKLTLKFPNASVILNTDLSMALAATQEIPSIVVIAGTGSAVIGRNSSEQLARQGGLGPILGDPGSAYDIGREAVVFCLRNFLRGEDSPLGHEILRLFHCNWVDLQDQIRANAEAIFPRVFPIVAKAANDGDAPARELLQSAAEDLSQLLAPVIETLGLGEQPFFLAKTGGVFGRSPFFDEPFDSLAARIAPKARLGPLPEPIADFAARVAIDCLDRPLPEAGN